MRASELCRCGVRRSWFKSHSPLSFFILICLSTETEKLVGNFSSSWPADQVFFSGGAGPQVVKQISDLYHCLWLLFPQGLEMPPLSSFRESLWGEGWIRSWARRWAGAFRRRGEKSSAPDDVRMWVSRPMTVQQLFWPQLLRRSPRRGADHTGKNAPEMFDAVYKSPSAPPWPRGLPAGSPRNRSCPAARRSLIPLCLKNMKQIV